MSKVPNKCPMCGEKKMWKCVAKDKKGFNAGKAVVGGMIFLPLGVIGGASGKKYERYACGKCQFTHEYKK